ncbi:MAG: tetratricopeptide repeat protein, partial [Eubacteriales bacterium]|nr:tetratricopeptide repeat protein [Eubacteriales bacterium]
MPNDGRMLPSEKKNNIVTLNLPPEKYLELADDKAARGEYIDALTLLDRALRFEPDNEELIIRRIEILTEIGDFEDAMWLIAKYIAKFGEDNERALILLGNLYFEMQEFGAALDAYTLVENRLDDSDLYDDEVDKMIEAMDY